MTGASLNHGSIFRIYDLGGIVVVYLLLGFSLTKLKSPVLHGLADGQGLHVFLSP